MKHKNTAKSFVANVQRAMEVAGTPRNGCPERLTRADLAKNAGVGRSTLSLHVELDADSAKSPNPKLEQICRIADALNVPPAFLLMREQDWTRLAQAIDYYAKLRLRGRHPALFANISSGLGEDAQMQSVYGLRLAKSMEVDGQVSDALLEASSQSTREDHARKTLATTKRILASASLPPISSMEPDERLAAFVISVVFGAHYQPETEEESAK